MARHRSLTFAFDIRSCFANDCLTSKSLYKKIKPAMDWIERNDYHIGSTHKLNILGIVLIDLGIWKTVGKT